MKVPVRQQDGKITAIHRMLYAIAVGLRSLPSNAHLNRSCGEARCCRPSHISIKNITASDVGDNRIGARTHCLKCGGEFAFCYVDGRRITRCPQCRKARCEAQRMQNIEQREARMAKKREYWKGLTEEQKQLIRDRVRIRHLLNNAKTEEDRKKLQAQLDEKRIRFNEARNGYRKSRSRKQPEDHGSFDAVFDNPDLYRSEAARVRDETIAATYDRKHAEPPRPAERREVIMRRLLAEIDDAARCSLDD